MYDKQTNQQTNQKQMAGQMHDNSLNIQNKNLAFNPK